MLILIHDTHRVGGWEQELHLGKCSVDSWEGWAEWTKDECSSWVCGKKGQMWGMDREWQWEGGKGQSGCTGNRK